MKIVRNIVLQYLSYMLTYLRICDVLDGNSDTF